MLWRIGRVDGGRIWNGRATWQRTTYDFDTRVQVRYVLRRGGDHMTRDDWLETDRWIDPLISLLPGIRPEDGDVDVRAAVEEVDE